MIKIFTNSKLKIILITLLLAICAIVIGIAVNLQIKNVLADNLLQQFVEQEALVADQVGSNLVNSVESVREKLTIASSLEDVNNSDPEICQPGLEKAFLTLESKVGNLGRVAADGFFTCSLNKQLVGLEASTLGPYIDNIFNDPNHEAVISNAIYPLGAPSHLAAIHVPVYDGDGNFDGTLGGAIYFNQLRDKFLKDITFAQNGFVVLFDSNGDVLYHPDESLIGQNVNTGEAKDFFDDTLRNTVNNTNAAGSNTGNLRYTAGNVEKIAAYKAVQVLQNKKWVVLVTVPVAEADAALTSVGLDNGFIAFTLVLAVAIFATAIAAMISRIKSMEIEIAKDEFLQLTTHQLQNPITAVKYFLEILMDKDQKPKLTKEQLSMVQEAYESNENEHLIVNDLLNVARLDSGRLILKTKEVDLAKVVNKSVANHELVLKKRKQTLETSIQDGLMAIVDSDRVRMVIDNLVSNASKYTPNGGKVEITAEQVRNKVVIKVIDSGVGIPQDKQKKLFKKFSRIENPLSGERGGTGLGLYIAQQIVNLHNGQISVSSIESKGTTFTVTLPTSA